MGQHITLNLGCRNPAGIDINEGYYALLLSIIKDISPDESIYHITGKRPEYKRSAIERKQRNLKKKIIKIYRENRELKYSEIAKIVGCTPQYVTVTLRSINFNRKEIEQKRNILKQEAINKIIQEHPDWSVNKIAKETGFSYTCVNKYYKSFYKVLMPSLFE